MSKGYKDVRDYIIGIVAGGVGRLGEWGKIGGEQRSPFISEGENMENTQ